LTGFPRLFAARKLTSAKLAEHGLLAMPSETDSLPKLVRAFGIF
jgi:hypothetical protein